MLDEKWYALAERYVTATERIAEVHSRNTETNEAFTKAVAGRLETLPAFDVEKFAAEFSQLATALVELRGVIGDFFAKVAENSGLSEGEGKESP